MPRVAYSEEERERIRVALVRVALDLMTKQGIQHTTVEQIYRRVGISRTFFYSFFPTKEDLIVETLYLQQPKIVAYARKLMADPALSWRDGVRQFLHACCYGEKNGIAVLTIEEQQLIFKRLSKESCQMFREKQARVWNHTGEFWNQGESGKYQPVYQSEPHGNGHTQGDPGHASAVCAGGRR